MSRGDCSFIREKKWCCWFGLGDATSMDFLSCLERKAANLLAAPQPRLSNIQNNTWKLYHTRFFQLIPKMRFILDSILGLLPFWGFILYYISSQGSRNVSSYPCPLKFRPAAMQLLCRQWGSKGSRVTMAWCNSRVKKNTRRILISLRFKETLMEHLDLAITVSTLREHASHPEAFPILLCISFIFPLFHISPASEEHRSKDM